MEKSLKRRLSTPPDCSKAGVMMNALVELSYQKHRNDGSIDSLLLSFGRKAVIQNRAENWIANTCEVPAEQTSNL